MTAPPLRTCHATGHYAPTGKYRLQVDGTYVYISRELI